MQVYGQLQDASFETLAADPAASTQGRVWYNSTSTRLMMDDGTLKRALLRNDQNLILGNSATAANNIRLQRGANSVLQLVAGNDVTAEGTLSTALAQISARHENYTYAGKPAVGNAGRVIYATDIATLLVDTGTAWTAIGGGGGGSSLQWLESGIAATPAIDSTNSRVYLFGQGQGQQLFAVLKVPASYVTGKAITMKIVFYSPDATGTALMQAVSTLIRPGTDTFNSTTNQRTTTNAAVTLTSANVPQAVTLDLTDASGNVNGVAVVAGSYLIVQLQRAVSDTGVSDIAFLPTTTEITMS